MINMYLKKTGGSVSGTELFPLEDADELLGFPQIEPECITYPEAFDALHST